MKKRKLSYEQKEWLERIQEIDVNNIIPDQKLHNRFKYGDDPIALKGHWWFAPNLRLWIEEWLTSGEYSGNKNDIDILNSLRIYYIDWLKENRNK